MAGFLSRERQAASASLKAQYGTETGKTQLNSVLRTLLNPEKDLPKTLKIGANGRLLEANVLMYF